MILSLNGTPLLCRKVKLMDRLKSSRTILSSKDDETRLGALMTNDCQMLVHLVWTLGHALVYSTLTSLVYNNLAPLPRHEIKLLETLTKSVPFSASKEVEAVLEVTDRMPVHGGWYCLFVILRC